MKPESHQVWIRHGWLVAALVGMALYAPSLRYDFTYDDGPIVKDNYRIRDILRPSAYLTTSYWNRPGQHKEYRPFVLLSYTLNYAVGEARPVTYHAANIFLHGCVCAALWWLAWLLFGRAVLATSAAILFAIHPIHVESVAGIVGRAELQSSLAFLVALIAALQSIRTEDNKRKWIWAGAAGVLAAIAFGTKENTVTLIPMLLLLVWADRQTATKHESSADHISTTLKSLVPVLLTTSIALAVYLLARRAVLRGFFSAPGQQTIFPLDNPLVTMHGLPRLMSAIKLMTRYALIFVFPFNPSPDYSMGAIKLTERLFDPAWIAGLALAIGLVWVLWRLRARPAALFGMGFFAVTFALTSNIFFLIGTVLAERLLYLPSAGICIFAAEFFEMALDKLKSKSAKENPSNSWLVRGMVFIALVWSAALVGQTLRYLPVWKSNSTLFGYMIRRVPDSVRANILYGSQAGTENRTAEAIEHFEKANRLLPQIPLTLSLLGSAYMQAGRATEARAAWEQSLRVDPNEPIAVVNMARLYAKEGNWTRAQSLYPLALQTEPGNYELRLDYGRMLEEAGKPADSVAQLEMLLPRAGLPDNELVVWTLAKAHRKLGNKDKEDEFLRRTLLVNPANRAAQTQLEALRSAVAPPPLN